MVRRIKVLCFPSLLVILLITLILSTGRGYAASPRSCGSWNIVPNPNPGFYDALNGVVAVAPNSVWAVGDYLGNNYHGQTLVEHWDGSSWSIIPSPNPGNTDDGFYGIAQIPGTDDLWAVGQLKGTATTFDYQTLIEYWNGTVWENVPSPNLNGGTSELSSVTALSSDDAWAVGSFGPDISGQTIQDVIEHWNGVQWSIVSSPNPGSALNYLNGVAAVSATNVWAVGQDMSTTEEYAVPMTLHWDGTAWSVVTSPNPGADGGTLLGAASIPGTQQLWATGVSYNSRYSGRTLTEKWNGTAWRVISSPNPLGSSNTLYAISALSSHDAWAVGSQQLTNSPSQNLILHWNGTAWSIVPAPKVGTDYNTLNSVTQIVSTTQAWTVGVHFSGTGTEGAFTALYC